MVAPRESVTLAEQFIRETCARQGIGRDHLTVYADRGTASIQDARTHGRVFFPRYNTEHHHRGLGLLTPADVLYPSRDCSAVLVHAMT